MRVDVLILLETPEADDDQRRVLCAAMQRRGWEVHPLNAFQAGLTGVEDDEEVVKLVERDVKEAVYVAGVTLYKGVCLLSDGGVGSDSDPEFVLGGSA